MTTSESDFTGTTTADSVRNASPARPLRWLVVDDNEQNRELMKAMITGEGHHIMVACDGLDALAVATDYHPDVVVSDILMPRMDGFQLCMRWQADPVLRAIPFVFCSADYIEDEDREFALGLGASAFLLKPVEYDAIKQISDLVRGGAGSSPAKPALESVSLDTLKQYNTRLFNKLEQKVKALKETSERLRVTTEGCLRALCAITEFRDPYTVGHERRVADLAAAIAQALGLPANEIALVWMAGMLHDVGKVAVPSEILSKPGRLSEIEFDMVKQHATAGETILREAQLDSGIDRVVGQHHERVDGSGYPLALHGDDILPAARIIAVADVVEAMSSSRPYRPTLSLDDALAEISQHAGTLYDADVVNACLKVFESDGFTFETCAKPFNWGPA